MGLRQYRKVAWDQLPAITYTLFRYAIQAYGSSLIVQGCEFQQDAPQVMFIRITLIALANVTRKDLFRPFREESSDSRKHSDRSSQYWQRLEG